MKISKRKFVLITINTILLISIIYSLNINIRLINSQHMVSSIVYEKSIDKITKNINLSDIENINRWEINNIRGITSIVYQIYHILPFGNEELKAKIVKYNKYSWDLDSVYSLKFNNKEIPADLYEKIMELDKLYKEGD